MRISILCSDADHPVNEYLERWVAEHCDGHEIEIVRSKNDVSGGEILFLISCGEIINAKDREKYRKSLVIHASDLPKGRGWSPHVWEIVEGAQEIALTLLDAEDKIDSGRIWKRLKVSLPKASLYDEINQLLFHAELELMSYALANIETIIPVEQDATVEPTYYKKRTPENSRIDPQRSIAEQFDLIRVCDPVRFPAFFELRGRKYRLVVERY